MEKMTDRTKNDTRSVVARISRIRESANLLIEQELLARGMLGILPAHGAVLQFLFQQQESVPIKSLVEKSGRVKSTVTGIVNTLERYGYLVKQECEFDARSTRITLTEKGRALQKEFEEISEKLLSQVFGDMLQLDRERLVELLSQVELNLKS
jgi:DNA-binding MarR family transcriptional regulator